MARQPRRGQQPPEPGLPDRRGNAAEFVAIPRGLPRSLLAGRRYEVALTMRNSGATTWRATGDQPHRLGSQRPRDTTRWGIGRIDVPTDVLPDSEVTFAFWVVAPTTPGRYHFQWRMVQDGVGWFGEPSDDAVVQVDHSPGASPSATGSHPVNLTADPLDEPDSSGRFAACASRTS